MSEWISYEQHKYMQRLSWKYFWTDLKKAFICWLCHRVAWRIRSNTVGLWEEHWKCLVCKKEWYKRHLEQ